LANFSGSEAVVVAVVVFFLAAMFVSPAGSSVASASRRPSPAIRVHRSDQPRVTQLPQVQMSIQRCL